MVLDLQGLSPYAVSGGTGMPNSDQFAVLETTSRPVREIKTKLDTQNKEYSQTVRDATLKEQQKIADAAATKAANVQDEQQKLIAEYGLVGEIKLDVGLRKISVGFFDLSKPKEGQLTEDKVTAIKGKLAGNDEGFLGGFLRLLTSITAGGGATKVTEIKKIIVDNSSDLIPLGATTDVFGEKFTFGPKTMEEVVKKSNDLLLDYLFFNGQLEAIFAQVQNKKILNKDFEIIGEKVPYSLQWEVDFVLKDQIDMLLIEKNKLKERQKD